VILLPSSYPAYIRIDSSSPPRKRRRMSSPTYDDQLAFPSQDELKAIGQLEVSLSQVPSHYRGCASKVLGTGKSSQDSLGLGVCTMLACCSTSSAELNNRVLSPYPVFLIDPSLHPLLHHFHDKNTTILTIHSRLRSDLLRDLSPHLPPTSSIQQLLDSHQIQKRGRRRVI
jgi:hypothetical protein